MSIGQKVLQRNVIPREKKNISKSDDADEGVATFQDFLQQFLLLQP
jgi:hypothetical protein